MSGFEERAHPLDAALRQAQAQSQEAAGPVPLLSVITDRKLVIGRTLDEVVKEAVSGGVNHVQIRESDLNARELLTLAEWLREIIGHQAVFVIHERVDIALACEADGVHLSPQGLPTRTVRKLVGEHRLIGRTIHTVAEAVRAARDGADYVMLGPVFASPRHPQHRPLGVGAIQVAARETGVPLLAYGGIDQSNVGAVIKGGATGVAVSSSIMKAERVSAMAQALLTEIEWAHNEPESSN